MGDSFRVMVSVANSFRIRVSMGDRRQAVEGARQWHCMWCSGFTAFRNSVIVTVICFLIPRLSMTWSCGDDTWILTVNLKTWALNDAIMELASTCDSQNLIILSI